MRIIKQGHKEPEAEIHCDYCNAYFSFTKSDVFRKVDDYNIRSYYVYCPCCNHKQMVSPWARDWFE